MILKHFPSGETADGVARLVSIEIKQQTRLYLHLVASLAAFPS